MSGVTSGCGIAGRTTPQFRRMPMSAEPNRRATLVDEISERTGITEAMIAELVDTFYGVGPGGPAAGAGIRAEFRIGTNTLRSCVPFGRPSS